MISENETYGGLFKKLGVNMNNAELLRRALTHSSFINEHGLSHTDCNERLEFLGDAVLELSISGILYERYPQAPEGELSRIRSRLVCRASLAALARQLCLGEYLLLGKGEEQTGGRDRESILENAAEAVIGAIYLDRGFTAAKEFVERFLANDIEHRQFFYDSKTILQEKVQQRKDSTIEYVLVKAEGPDHDRRFTAQVVIDGRICGTGTGRSKQEAQQRAAYQALITEDI